MCLIFLTNGVNVCVPSTLTLLVERQEVEGHLACKNAGTVIHKGFSKEASVGSGPL